MESVNIKKLLDAYFEGNTSLAEEKILQEYFTTGAVADDLLEYQPLFSGLKAAKNERSGREISIPESDGKSQKRRYWYPVAAALIVAFGVGSFYLSQPNFSPQEKEALAAFEESKN